MFSQTRPADSNFNPELCLLCQENFFVKVQRYINCVSTNKQLVIRNYYLETLFMYVYVYSLSLLAFLLI